MKWLALLLTVLTLAACDRQVTTAEDILRGVTRADLNTVSGSLLLAEFPSAGRAATLQVAQNREGIVTWRTGDNRHLTFEDGVLTGTRGLGFDLMSGDVGVSAARLRSGAASYYPRFHSTLDGEHQVRLRAFQCRQTGRQSETLTIVGLAQTTTRVTEVCTSPGLPEVTNLYWLGADGTMWQSRQWISEGAGYLNTRLLVR